MSAIQIRPYILSDYPAVKNNLMEGDIFDEDEDTEEKLREKIRRNPESILVAVVDKKVVGNVFITEDGWVALVFRLAVAKQYRKQGIGKKLLQEAEKRISKIGHKEVHILVDLEKTELQSYYEKLGYIKGNNYKWMYKLLK